VTRLIDPHNRAVDDREHPRRATSLREGGPPPLARSLLQRGRTPVLRLADPDDQQGASQA
jgi:hypothetical protein